MKKTRGLLAVALVLLSVSVVFQNCSPTGNFSADVMTANQAQATDLEFKLRAKSVSTTTTQVLTLTKASLSAVQGQSLTFTTRFNASPMPASYMVFVHIVNSSGATVLGSDYAPAVPTTKWKGLVTHDSTVQIPASLPTGTYTVRTGLYLNAPPYSRAKLSMGSGVTVDGELRYIVGKIQVSASAPAPAPAPSPAPAPASCTFNGQTLSSGSSVTAYQVASVPYGSSCVSEVRTCSNGVLSGSYQYASCAVAPAPSPAPVPAPSSGPAGQDANAWSLVFSDEFDGTSLDTSKWNDHLWYESSNPTKNYSVENGALYIWPQRDASGNFFNRTIDTDGKYQVTYGYFEAEAKLPVGRGPWPAFWLYAHPSDARPEIDIMEAYSGGGTSSGWSDSNLHPTNFGMTLHKANADYSYHEVPYSHTSAEFIGPVDFSAAFHKYAAKWDSSGITFYLDGKQIGPKYSDTAGYYNRPMYLLLDLWFGSASGTPDSSTPTGKGNSYIINYVRAWKAN